MANKKEITMVVRLTPYLDNELNRISEEWGSSKSDIIRVALMDFISEMDEERIKAIAERIALTKPVDGF